jgi:glycine betaine transporter
MAQIKTIMVPVDFTEYSNRAVDYAVRIAHPFKAKIRLLHVIEQFTYSVTDTIQVVDHYAALKAIADPLMESLKGKLRRKGLAVDTLVVRGTPYLKILEQARKDRSDLIIMGTHGRTGVQHLVLGSVAERVVRLAPCPVMTVRGRPGGKKAPKGVTLI